MHRLPLTFLPRLFALLLAPLFCLLLGGLLGGLSLTATAGEPPTAPMLRIDPGEHTAMIKRIASDAAGRWLVTASPDKTARVWDLADGKSHGKLLATLRPPIGAGNEGKLYAVAMSPDGQTVALGGGTGSWDKEGHIYLFDRASGRLLRRLSGLPNVILHLVFSPDGRTLAASLGGDNGLRLFAVADGRLLGEDRDYGSDSYSYSVDFRPDGQRLVTTSLDGQVRLYRWDGENLSLLAKQPAPGGKQPYAARFSPDGRRIAVGFNDTAAVNVLDGDDLSLLYTPESAGVNGNLPSVAWSRDGASLFAAGAAQRQFEGRWQSFIRRWAVDARQAGKPVDWPVASDTIMDLLPLPGSGAPHRLAFASGAPEWGVVTAAGNATKKRTLFHAPAVADFRDNHAGFTLSADAAQVRFGYELFGKTPAVFDSQARTFLAADTPGLSAPRLTAPGLAVSDWENTPAPKLNGQPLKLEQYEISRSLALLPDVEGEAPGFVLGTGRYLRAFDRNDNETWQQPVPGVVWAVNVSRDGRWVVAAYADGTIRWHRATDGAEQLAFYPHPDQKRWVLWTPAGYYDASPGAEDLIGWHVNNGKDAAADFFPAGRFRDRFYRPDVLAKVLQTQNEAEALRLANAESGKGSGQRTQQASIAEVLPPVVSLLSHQDGDRFETGKQVLRYSVRSPADAPFTGVKVLVDGRPIELQRGLQPARVAGEQRLEITLPERDLELALIAENKNGASVAVRARLVFAGRKVQEFVAKPRLYVLAVGVSDYADKALKLAYAAKDAQDFAAAFKQQSALYKEVITKVLPNASAEQVLDGLDWLRSQVTAKDVGVLFLAGHGVNDADGDYYFLPRDANPDRLRRTAVPYFEVKKTLSSLPGKTLAFIDTCHSGNIMGARRGVADITAVINDLTAAENGVVVFASSTGRQFSLENSEWNNGAFTKALVEGLSGRADYTQDGAVTINELDTWLADRVKQLTRNQQTPTTTKPNTVQDFPVAVVR
ncbi:MAG: caspase family protein [Pseudomonadota bacterium]|nr:caspase family protein [Pseudomonadota bacterium]